MPKPIVIMKKWDKINVQGLREVHSNGAIRLHHKMGKEWRKQEDETKDREFGQKENNRNLTTHR